MDDLELIKENVQPLRSGRRIDTLRAAFNLDENDAKKREETRLQFEKQIQDTENTNLFDTYFNYINWIEQNYPQGGKDSNLKSVLEKFIKTFYKNEQYKNDERALSIFLKYINMVSDALDVFECFYKLGFAKKLALYYTSWSYHFEMQNNYKKAMNVVKLGIKNEAQPMSELSRTLIYLQVITMRSVSANDDTESNKRKALNNLKGIKGSDGKLVAPIKRYGNAVKENNCSNKAGTSTSEKNNVPNAQLKIFDENNEPVAGSSSQCQATDLIAANNQENDRKPEKWSENKLSLKKINKAVDNFEIYVETDNNKKIESNEQISPKPDSTNECHPIARFESEEQLKKYIWFPLMNEIYKNNTEYSIEELRYEKWLKAQAAHFSKKEIPMCFNNADETLPKQSTSTIVRGYFNGPLSTTVYNETQSQMDRSKFFTDNDYENDKKFDIYCEPSFCIPATDNNSNVQENLESKPKNKLDITLSVLKDDEFRSCSSSTPTMNKTFKRSANLALRHFSNPNFVTGITTKLSTIVETSREEYSKSSSSSSGTMSTTGCLTQRKPFANTENINPFDSQFHSILLNSLSDPVEFRKKFFKRKLPLPEFKFQKSYKCDNNFIKLINQIASSIYQVKSLQDIDSEEEPMLYSMKVHQSLNYWEFYIYDELERCMFNKMNSYDIELSIMTVVKKIFFDNGSVTIYDLDMGWNLKNMLNILKKHSQPFPKIILSYLTLELMIIIQQLHEWNIIHTAIKPENIILNISNIEKRDISLLPTRTTLLRLVDFSNAINMKLLPDGTTFNKNYSNEKLFDILDSRNWACEIDWIGFLNCVHLMLFGSEIEVISENSRYKTTSSFKNVDNGNCFDRLFDFLLNLEPKQKPNIEVYIDELADYVKQKNYGLTLFEYAKLTMMFNGTY